MPNNVTLPVETLDAIVQELISTLPEGTEDDSFLPRRQRQLAPLLYVCKIWRAVTERQMYRVISVGKTIAPAMTNKAAKKRRAEKGYGISVKLLDTLKLHPRLAAYVEALELAVIPGEDWGHEILWTRINTHIIQACPNVKHIDNLGNYDSYPTPAPMNLMTVLKEKSLVSFRFRTRSFYNNLNLCDMLLSWPRLKTLHFRLCSLSDVSSGESILCCPELREIQIENCDPLGQHYDFLRSITDCVTKFYITSLIAEIREREAFYKCLRAWSMTLTHLRIRVDVLDHYPTKITDYNPLWAVISTMTELRELQVYAELADSMASSVLNLSFIIGLSKLERLCIAPRWDFRWPDIDALESSKHLPALRHIVCWDGKFENAFDQGIGRVCRKRDIKLEKWYGIWRYSKIPGFVL